MNFANTLKTAVFSLFFTAIVTACNAAEKPANTWSFQDYFARNWSNELVTYPIDQKTADNKKLALFGPDDRVRPYQILRDEKQNKIAFLADVPADQLAAIIG